MKERRERGRGGGGERDHRRRDEKDEIEMDTYHEREERGKRSEEKTTG